jgi:hypothetical protein
MRQAVRAIVEEYEREKEEHKSIEILKNLGNF